MYGHAGVLRSTSGRPNPLVVLEIARVGQVLLLGGKKFLVVVLIIDEGDGSESGIRR